MKKILLGLGSIAAIATPIAAVVACGSTPKTTPTNTGTGNSGTPGATGGTPGATGTGTTGYTFPTITPALVTYANTEAITSQDIAFITDGNPIANNPFNEAILKGVQGATSKVVSYEPDNSSKESIGEQYQKAIDNGSKLIVVAGIGQKEVLSTYSTKYPEVGFV